jgi:hypothetical protein
MNTMYIQPCQNPSRDPPPSVNQGRNSETRSTRVAIAVIRSGCDHLFMSKVNDVLLEGTFVDLGVYPEGDWGADV